MVNKKTDEIHEVEVEFFNIDYMLSVILGYESLVKTGLKENIKLGEALYSSKEDKNRQVKIKFDVIDKSILKALDDQKSIDIKVKIRDVVNNSLRETANLKSA